MSNDSKNTEVDLNKLYSLCINSLKIEIPKTIKVDLLVKYIEDEIKTLKKAEETVGVADILIHTICVGKIAEAETILEWVKQHECDIS